MSPTRRPAAAHTAFLPLSVVNNGETTKIRAADGSNVAGMQFVSLRGRHNVDDINALADLMVLATNNHASLLAALEAARVVVEADGARATLAIIDAALERARG